MTPEAEKLLRDPRHGMRAPKTKRERRKLARRVKMEPEAVRVERAERPKSALMEVRAEVRKVEADLEWSEGENARAARAWFETGDESITAGGPESKNEEETVEESGYAGMYGFPREYATPERLAERRALHNSMIKRVADFETNANKGPILTGANLDAHNQNLQARVDKPDVELSSGTEDWISRCMDSLPEEALCDAGHIHASVDEALQCSNAQKKGLARVDSAQVQTTCHRTSPHPQSKDNTQDQAKSTIVPLRTALGKLRTKK
jgi:hypothetical protein